MEQQSIMMSAELGLPNPPPSDRVSDFPDDEVCDLPDDESPAAMFSILKKGIQGASSAGLRSVETVDKSAPLTFDFMKDAMNKEIAAPRPMLKKTDSSLNDRSDPVIDRTASFTLRRQMPTQLLSSISDVTRMAVVDNSTRALSEMDKINNSAEKRTERVGKPKPETVSELGVLPPPTDALPPPPPSKKPSFIGGLLKKVSSIGAKPSKQRASQSSDKVEGEDEPTPLPEAMEVWVADPDDVWIMGRVESQVDRAQLLVRTSDRGMVKVDMSEGGEILTVRQSHC